MLMILRDIYEVMYSFVVCLQFIITFMIDIH